MGPRARQEILGARGGILGAADGIEAGREKGGRPRKWSASSDKAVQASETGQLQAQIIALADAGLSNRKISAQVFGDTRFYKRVERLLKA